MFDSTGTFDGITFKKTDGCYFQEALFSVIVCTKCNKHVLFGDYKIDDYKEFYAKLKAKLGSSKDIYDYIYWQVPVGKIEGENYDTPIYKFTETPRTTDITSLLGTPKMTPRE